MPLAASPSTPETLDTLAPTTESADEHLAEACRARLRSRTAIVFTIVGRTARRAAAPRHVTVASSGSAGALNINGVRLHDLRHLHATQLLAAGVPVRTVSGRLGHANAATTLNVYAHFLEASDRQAADVIAGLLDRPRRTKCEQGRTRVHDEASPTDRGG